MDECAAPRLSPLYSCSATVSVNVDPISNFFYLFHHASSSSPPSSLLSSLDIFYILHTSAILLPLLKMYAPRSAFIPYSPFSRNLNATPLVEMDYLCGEIGFVIGVELVDEGVVEQSCLTKPWIRLAAMIRQAGISRMRESNQIVLVRKVPF